MLWLTKTQENLKETTISIEVYPSILTLSYYKSQKLTSRYEGTLQIE